MSCPDCKKGVVLAGTPKGTTNPDGSYLAAADPSKPSKRAVLILTDAFGLSLPNPKIQADEMSAALNCDVWVPDIFAGWPLFPHGDLDVPDRAGVKLTLGQKISFFFAILRRLPALIASRPSVVDGRLAEFLKRVQAEKHYEKIGAVGYCYGGSTAVRLGGMKQDGKHIVDSVVVAHPGGFSQKQLEDLNVPSSWVCAEDDFTFAEKTRNETEAKLAARSGDRKKDYEFKVYKGTAHGFGARPNLELPEIKEAYESSRKQTFDWFSKTLTV